MPADYLGNEIEVGDYVIFVEKNYRNFKIGQIKRLTEQMVFVEYPARWGNGKSELRQAFSQVVKISDKEAFIHKL